ncbi:MAG: hypothetical protein U0835_08060 [Isosphaeraceae bacterium]
MPGTHRIGITGVFKVGSVTLPMKFRNPSSSGVEVEVAEGKTEYPIDLN